MDYITELEKKVDAIIRNLEQSKQENAKLKEAALECTDELAKIKGENSSLKNELDSIKSTTQEHQEKLQAATDKIKALIAKIDAV